jgi:hypothetical protein
VSGRRVGSITPTSGRLCESRERIRDMQIVSGVDCRPGSTTSSPRSCTHPTTEAALRGAQRCFGSRTPSSCLDHADRHSASPSTRPSREAAASSSASQVATNRSVGGRLWASPHDRIHAIGIVRPNDASSNAPRGSGRSDAEPWPRLGCVLVLTTTGTWRLLLLRRAFRVRA